MLPEGPEQTLRAFAEHGEGARSLDTNPAEASQVLADAAAAGIDLASVTAELEREGVQSFCDSYHQLLDCIESKISELAPFRHRDVVSQPASAMKPPTIVP